MASPVKRGTPKSAAAVIVNEQAKNIVSRNEEDCKMRKESKSKDTNDPRIPAAVVTIHLDCEGNIFVLVVVFLLLFGYL